MPSHSPCRDRDSEPQGDSSHMHGCSRGGQAQVLGSMSSLHASNQLDQSVRWVWGSVQSELSKGRALELRHRVRFLKDKTAWSSAAVTAPRIVQAESGALPACSGGEIRHGARWDRQVLILQKPETLPQEATWNWSAPLP